MHILENINGFDYDLENTHKIVRYNYQGQKITQEIDHDFNTVVVINKSGKVRLSYDGVQNRKM